ncbi:MAG: hypothetical protein ABI950_09935 [Solirubrobacteraceae bacterium]
MTVIDRPSTIRAASRRRRRRLTSAVAAVFAGGALAGAAGAATVATPAFDVATGSVGTPSIYVDGSGTAHIAWNQAVDGAPDVLHYCRVPRGGRACTGEKTFVPDQDYAYGGNGPAFNTQFAGLEILPAGGRIVLLSHRYPNVVQKPDGNDSSDATYAWTSGDGGQTFDGPALVGDGRFAGGALAFGSGTIGTISDTTTGGTFFQAVAPGGYTSEQANLGASGPDQAYDGSLADVDANTPVAAFDDLHDTTYLRQYSGSGDINSAASWLAPVVVGASTEPRLASGPKGVFLITHAEGGAAKGTYVVRRYASGGTLSAPIAVSSAAAIRRALFEDGAGALHVAWFDRTTTSEHAVIQARASANGTAWGPVATLADVGTADANGLRLSGAADGAGFAIWTSSTPTGAAITMAPYAPDPPATVPTQTDPVSAAGLTGVRVACHPTGPCAGSIRLLSGTAPAARAAAVTRTVLARGRFSLKAGRTGRVRLHLGRAAQRLLARSGRLRVTASVVSTRGGTHRRATGLVILRRGHR